jgi:drug/metabolite transporter (DMT)-like permease
LNPVTPRKGRLLITAAALLWSTGGLAIKLVPLPAAGVAFWRSLLTAIFLIVVLRPGLDRWRRAS